LIFGIDGRGAMAFPSIIRPMRFFTRIAIGVFVIGEVADAAPDPNGSAPGLHMSAGHAAVRRGDNAAAEGEFLAAIQDGRRAHHDQETAEALYSVGQVYRHEHREGEAVGTLKEALAIEDRIFGPEDTRTGEVLAELAATYITGSEINDAKPYVERLRPIAPKYRGPEREFVDTLFKAVEPDESDAKLADRLAKKAAAGDREAEFKLGTCYELGRGVPQDFGRARELYLSAAAKGNVRAMYYLGVVYDKGRGVPADDGTAAQWYRQAADAGYPIAQFNYGVFLLQGRGGERSPARALEYFKKADAQGYPSAKTGILKAEQALNGDP